MVVVGRAVGAQRIPHGERHAEEALAADAPVAVQAVDPALITRAHVGGMPLQLTAAREQLVAKLDRLDEPLPAGHDLERPIALLEELDVMRDRPRLADEIAALPQQVRGDRLRLLGGQSGHLVVRGLRPRRVLGFPARRAPGHRTERPVRLDDSAHRQLQLAPPDDVGDVAERADHGDAAALFGVGQRMRLDRHPRAEHRRHDVGAEQRLIALVVGMSHERDARGQQLGTRGLDLDHAAVGLVETEAMVRAGLLAIFELGLRHRGLEVHVPQRRRFDLIREPAIEQAQEHQLRHALRRACRWSRRSSTSQPTARGTARDARTLSRPRA